MLRLGEEESDAKLVEVAVNQFIGLTIYRVIDGEESVSFSARVVEVNSSPASCVVLIFNSARDPRVRSFNSYGGETFQALYIAMRTTIRLLIGHFEELPDEMFGLGEHDIESGDGLSSAEMIDLHSQIYANWVSPP